MLYHVKVEKLNIYLIYIENIDGLI